MKEVNKQHDDDGGNRDGAPSEQMVHKGRESPSNDQELLYDDHDVTVALSGRLPDAGRPSYATA
jgi:hypothetical protein